MELVETHTLVSIWAETQLLTSHLKLNQEDNSALKRPVSLRKMSKEVEQVVVQQRDCITMSMEQEEIHTFTKIMVDS